MHFVFFVRIDLVRTKSVDNWKTDISASAARPGFFRVFKIPEKIPEKPAGGPFFLRKKIPEKPEKPAGGPLY